MRLRDRWRALRVLIGERLRTFLTLLGIMIGSGAIVLVAGLVHGAEVALVAANQSISGSDLVQIRSQDMPPRERQRGRPELSRSDSEAIGDSAVGANREVHSESTVEVRADVGAKRKQVRIVSATPGSADLFRLGVASGRFIDPEDMRLQKRVAVVGEEVWQDLFAGVPFTPGLTMRADNVIWEIVGVLKHKPMIGSTTGTNIWSRKALVPETTYDGVYPREHRVDRVVLLGERVGGPKLSLDVVRPSVADLLFRRHRGARNFKLDDHKEREMEDMIIRVIELLLIASGVLTLATGAINVANVMFVSVSERTREIGLRRALGETKASILAQFLLEAATLGLVGGTIGVGVGVAAVLLGGLGMQQVFPEFAAAVQPWSLGAGFGLSILAGLVAGLVPAFRAAQLDPVAALRAE